jgi:hypothetical protein
MLTTLFLQISDVVLAIRPEKNLGKIFYHVKKNKKRVFWMSMRTLKSSNWVKMDQSRFRIRQRGMNA